MWVQILMLPKELYNKQYLIKVRNLLGNMMNIDENIFVNNKLKFARICVELDLRKELVPSFLLFGQWGTPFSFLDKHPRTINNVILLDFICIKVIISCSYGGTILGRVRGFGQVHLARG